MQVWPRHPQLSGSESLGEWSRAECGGPGPVRKGEEQELLQQRNWIFLGTGGINLSKVRSLFLLGGVTEAALRNYLQNWTGVKYPH